jgi:1-deoxy-D-xylulose-5-phosphate reductoisomerase
MKKITILGSTGSIGQQTLEVISWYKEFKVIGLVAGRNIKLLRKQIEVFNPDVVSVFDKEKAKILKTQLRKQIKIFCGEEGVKEVLKRKVDLIVSALVGNAGILPTYLSIKNCSVVALANKESLVSAGDILIPLAKKNKTKIIPVDSEHSAIFQCLVGEKIKEIKRIILTASGGPFRNFSLKKLKKVKPKDALSHPTWNMGKKITIDSATLMNKGLEILEAKFLFNLPIEKIFVLIHPQSIVHSIVEFIDKSVKMQAYLPDMRLPIQYALFYPSRIKTPLSSLNLTKKILTFETPDEKKFQCLSLAKEAGKIGGSMPCVLNSANEVAVSSFLKGKISFLAIPKIIKKTMERHSVQKNISISSLLYFEKWAKIIAEEEVKKCLHL